MSAHHPRFGAVYRGAEDEQVVTAACEHCGTRGRLRSFTTTEVRTLLSLRGRPLGRLRIVRQCGVCAGHRRVPLEQWQAEQREVEAEASAAVTGGQPAVLRAALARALQAQHEPALSRLDVAVWRDPGADLALSLEVGSAWLALGRPEAAARILEAAHRATASDRCLADLARARARGPRPESAEATLARMVEVTPTAVAPILAEGMAALAQAGRHREAVWMGDRLAARLPALTRDPALDRLRRQSATAGGLPPEWPMGTRPADPAGAPAASPVHPGVSPPGPSLPVDPAARPVVLAIPVDSAAPPTVPASHGPAPAPRWRWTLSRVWLAVTLVSTVIGLALAAVPMLPKVVLVNGLDVPYEVAVDGAVIRLDPMRESPVQLGAGVHRVEGLGAASVLAPVELEVRRSTSREAVVVNLDRSALLWWEEVVYEVKYHQAPKAEAPRAHMGQGLYRFPRIRYLFREAPEEIRTQGRGETRRRLSLVQGTWPEVLSMAEVLVSEADLAAALRSRLQMRPDDPAGWASLSEALGFEAFEEAVAPVLATRPLNFGAHEAWQGAVLRWRPGRDLEAEYRALHEALPGSAAAAYLLARMIPPGEESGRLFDRAREAQTPRLVRHARTAQALDALAEGRPRDALTLLAEQNAPDERQSILVWQALQAAEAWDVLRPEDEDYEDDPAGWALWDHYLSLRQAAPGAAREDLEAFIEGARAGGGFDVDLEALQARAEAQTLCVAGDAPGLYAYALEHPSLVPPALAPLLAGDLDEAAAADDEWGALLLVYAAAQVAGEGEVSEALLTRLEADPLPWRQAVAGLLAARQAPSAAALRRAEQAMDLDLETRRRLLLAVGARFPQARRHAWTRARHLAYDHQTPLSLVEHRILTGGGY